MQKPSFVVVVVSRGEVTSVYRLLASLRCSRTGLLFTVRMPTEKKPLKSSLTPNHFFQLKIEAKKYLVVFLIDSGFNLDVSVQIN